MSFLRPTPRQEDLWNVIIIVLVFAGGVGALLQGTTPGLVVLSVAVGVLMPARHLARLARAAVPYRPPVGVDSHELPAPARRPTECIVGVDRSEPVLDVARAVSPPDGFAERVRFATTDRLIEDITRLNVYGYAGTPYGTRGDQRFFERKLERNRAIARRNPFALATVVDERNPDLYLGFTAVLPLTADGSRRYLNGPGVPDNEVTGAMVARDGAAFHDVLFFAISQMKMFRGCALQDLRSRKVVSREPDLQAVGDLVRLITYQLGTLVATANVRGEIHLVGQSKAESVQKHFGRMGMVEAPHIITADEEPAYHALLQVTQVDLARTILGRAVAVRNERHLPSPVPHVAAQLPLI